MLTETLLECDLSLDSDQHTGLCTLRENWLCLCRQLTIASGLMVRDGLVWPPPLFKLGFRVAWACTVSLRFFIFSYDLSYPDKDRKRVLSSLFHGPQRNFSSYFIFWGIEKSILPRSFFLWSSGGYSSFQSQACKIHPSLDVVFVKKVQRKLDKLFRPIDL